MRNCSQSGGIRCALQHELETTASAHQRCLQNLAANMMVYAAFWTKDMCKQTVRLLTPFRACLHIRCDSCGIQEAGGTSLCCPWMHIRCDLLHLFKKRGGAEGSIYGTFLSPPLRGGRRWARRSGVGRRPPTLAGELGAHSELGATRNFEHSRFPPRKKHIHTCICVYIYIYI